VSDETDSSYSEDDDYSFYAYSPRILSTLELDKYEE